MHLCEEQYELCSNPQTFWRFYLLTSDDYAMSLAMQRKYFKIDHDVYMSFTRKDIEMFSLAHIQVNIKNSNIYGYIRVRLPLSPVNLFVSKVEKPEDAPVSQFPLRETCTLAEY